MKTQSHFNYHVTFSNLHAICKATDEQGKPYYLVKNSWGKSGQYKGIWYMSRDYMALNTTYLFLNRHALSDDFRKEMQSRVDK